MLAQSRPHQRQQSPAGTDAASSGLSELQDDIDDGLGNDSNLSEEDITKDNDTEAETERLHPTPHKHTRINPELAFESSQPDRQPDDDDDEIGSAPSEGGDDQPREGFSVHGASRIKLPSEMVGKKRKRSSSLSEADKSPELSLDRSRKRDGTSRPEPFDPDNELQALGEDGAEVGVQTDNATTHEDQGNENGIEEGDDADSDSKERAEDDAMVDDASPRRAINALDDGIDVAENLTEEPDAAPGEDADGEEFEKGEGDDEEAEPAGKSEDEQAKRRTAMDSLMPVENLFAIFRDRLFDERLELLSAELDTLKRANTQHPTYLAMRQTIDARRDEKITIERTGLEYRLKELERRTQAERAIRHGQYFQEARELREYHCERLNENYTRIQRERRQWKAKEPHFIALFNPKRSSQIRYQQAYNKEVSLLSGIARHVGFPAAPDIRSAKASEIDEDMQKMKIRPQTTSYVAQIANSQHVDEMSGEQQFLEKNPWARSHSAVQRITLQNESSRPGRQRTPASQSRVPDVYQGSGGSGSNLDMVGQSSTVRAQKPAPRQFQDEDGADAAHGRPSNISQSEMAKIEALRKQRERLSQHSQQNATYRHNSPASITQLFPRSRADAASNYVNDDRIGSNAFYSRSLSQEHRLPNGGKYEYPSPR